MRPDLILASWWRTKRAMHMSAGALAKRRAHMWAGLSSALARTPALAAYHGCALAEYPVTNPAEMRKDYGAWNGLGMSDAELRALADAGEAGEAQGEISAGWSSGSGGGKRGLFVAHGAERADYVGQSLARLLPASALLKRHRLALHLRASNALYNDVENGRFAFTHFPLETATNATIAALIKFEPTILIAPPHRLLSYAKAGLRLPSLRHLFCGSEAISPAESEYLTSAFGLRPSAIYQATEGFLGAECSEGRLHLNEHSIQFEFESVVGTTGYRSVITDLHRTSQPIVRLRGDDYIELDKAPCPCRFGGRTIDAPQGRVGDIWRFADRNITPPQVVAAVEGVIGGAVNWQASADPKGVAFRVEPSTPAALAIEAAQALVDLTGKTVSHSCDLAEWAGPKRRKVVWGNG